MRIENDGTIIVEGKKEQYQVNTGSNTYGGPMVISIYSTQQAEEKTFNEVTSAVRHLKKLGVKKSEISKARRELWMRFKTYRRKKKRGKVGAVEGETDTEV